MTPLVVGVVGSTAYGLDTENSDIDWLGFYAAPTREILGLGVEKVVDKTIVTKDPDQQMHEVGKYIKLALQGNPTILELMWLPEYETAHYVARELLIGREKFLSKQIAKRYGGYVLQQVKRLESRNAEGKEGFDSDLKKRTAKHARHCYRLLLQGAELLKHGEMHVKLSQSERMHCFLAGDLAEKDPVGFRKAIDENLEWFDEVAAKSTLPENPDREWANGVLVDIRTYFLTH